MIRWIRTAKKPQLSSLILFCVCIPSILNAQWGYNGYEIPYLMNGLDIVPGPDNSVWVLQGLLAGPEYSVSYLQRYDEDGYPMFEQPGIRATEMNVVSDPMGILPTSDGGVVLGFVASMDEEYGNSIYGQRYSADGEKLWGPDGAPAILTHLLADNYPNYPTICSDGNDGFWCYFFDSPNTPIYVCGLNSDGSMKVDDPILIREDLWPSGDYVAIAEGDSGGAYIAYITSRYEDITNIQHVNADGTLRWRHPPTLFEYPTPRNMPILKAQNNNFYTLLSNGTSASSFVVMYFNNEAEMLWDNYLRFLISANTRTSNAVIFSDGSLGVVGRGDSTVFVRIRPDGTPYYEDGYAINLLHSRHDFVENGRNLLVSNDSTFLYCTYTHHYDNIRSNFRIQKIALSDGHECWHDSIYVTDPHDGWLYGKTTITSDNDLVIISVDNNFHGYLFKVNEDGSVAGRTDAVSDEQQEIAQPTGFRILSLYPNPFNNEIILELDVQQVEAISITLYNLLGESVYDLQPEVKSGFNRLSMSMAKMDLSTGTYFVSVSCGEEQLIRKVVFLR